MKKPIKFIACGTSVLFAAVLGLQAQTGGSGTSGTSGATGTSGTATSPSPGTPQSTSQFGSTSGTQSTSPYSSSTNNSQSMSGSANGSFNANGSANSSMNSSTNSSMTNPSATSPNNSYSNSSSSNNNNTATGAASTSNTQQYGAQANSQSTQSSQTFSGSASTVSNEQVTTFVQQLDAQGPAVVQTVSTQVGDLACSQDTVQNLVDALHNGQSVQITSNVNGQAQTATFNPNGSHLGYGEASLAIALAAQELHNAGVTSCATPQQWQAVLFGGPLNISSTSTSTNATASAGSTSQFPGIVTLHTQGQGWGEIAQSNNLQISQIISNNSSAGQPTGFSSSQMNQGHVDANTPAPDDNGNHKGEKKHHWWNFHKDKDKDTNVTENENSNVNSNSNTNATGSTTATPSTR